MRKSLKHQKIIRQLKLQQKCWELIIKRTECTQKRLGCFNTNPGYSKNSRVYKHKEGYEFTEDYFECLDSQEKAYFLGFLAADGSVHNKANRLTICLAKRDVDVIEKLCDALSYNKSHIIEYNAFYYDENRVKKIFPSVRISLFSKKNETRFIKI